MTVTMFAPRDPAFVASPWAAFAALRAQAPVQWDDDTQRWLAFSHDAANAVLRDRRLGRLWHDREPVSRWEPFNLLHREQMMENEPPRHTQLRKKVARAFTRGHVERLRPTVARLARELLDALDDSRPVDLLAGFAEPLPVAVIAALLGVPDVDRPLLRPWSNAIVKMYEHDVDVALEDAALRASSEFTAYVRELIALRRRSPGADLVTDLVAEDLSVDEVVATVVLLLNAGHEASVNVLGNGVHALLRHPDQLALLRADASLVPSAVEEMIRFDGPLQLFERTATDDVALGDVVVRRGQRAVALLGAANRDPAVFSDPDHFDVGRDPNPHLGFGAGIHFCLGAPLARMELQVSLTLLLERYRSIELAADPVYRPTFVLRGLQSLPVTLSRG